MKFTKSAIAIVAMTMGVGAQAAVIDLFTANQGGALGHTDLSVDSLDTGTIITDGVGDSINGADILGGNRDLYVSLLADPNGNGANIKVKNGSMSFNVGSGARGRGQIQWDGPESTEAIDYDGLAGAILSDSDNIALDIIFSDLGFRFDLSIYTNATTFTTVSLVSSAHASPVTTLIDLDAFAHPEFFGTLATCQAGGILNPAPGVTRIFCGPDGPVNLANVGALVADIDPLGGTVSVDLTIDAAQTVPEPGTLGLLSLGLVGLGFSATRRRPARNFSSI